MKFNPPNDATLRPLKKRPDFFVWIVTIIVISMVTAGLVISAGAIREKIRIGEAVQQIVGLTSAIRDAAGRDNTLGVNFHDDLITAVHRTGQVSPTGSKDGMASLSNPWNEAVIAFSVPGNIMRIETEMSSRVCYRLLSVFGQDPPGFGIHRIEVRGASPNWRLVYSESMSGPMNDTQVDAACADNQPITLALHFNLR